MKKKIIFLTSLILLAIGSYFVDLKTDEVQLGSLELETIATAFAESSTGNTGPKESRKCGKTFCNLTEYFCKCTNQYPCTERLCNH